MSLSSSLNTLPRVEHWYRWLLTLAVVACIGIFPNVSRALGEDDTWTVRPEIGTDLPVQFGGGVLVEGPYRLRGRLAIGYLPGAYVGLANTLAQGLAPDYTDKQAKLVRSALRTSLAWRTQLGWRPFADAGFYTHLSYTALTLGGTVRSDDVVDAALARDTLPDSLPSTDIDFDSSAHMMGFELGWEFDLVEDLVLRLALGWAYTIAAHADVDVRATPDPDIRGEVENFENDTERVVERAYRQYLHPPTLGIGLGWRF